jgi:DNA primase
MSQFLDRALEVYRDQYPGSLGEAYLRGREFYEDPERVGYAPGGHVLIQSGLSPELLWNFGLIRKDGSDLFRRRVVLPYTWEGRTSCLFGRSIVPGTPKDFRHLHNRCHGRARSELGEHSAADTARSPWLASTGRYENWRWVKGVYGERNLDAATVMVVEGALDAEASRLLGLPPAVALGGSGVRLLLGRLRPGQTVLACTDPDAGGELSYEVIKDALGDRVTRVKDPADYLRLRMSFLRANSAAGA